MKKIFEFEMALGPIEIPAAMLWCPERRLKGLRGRFAAAQGIDISDPLLVAGGVKSIVMPSHPRDAQFLLEQIETLQFHHGFTTLYAMAHTDCAACNNNRDPSYYETLLFEAGDILRHRFPHLEVITVFVGVDGVHLVEREDASLAVA